MLRSLHWCREEAVNIQSLTMTADDFRPADAQVPSFDAPYAPPDEDIAAAFLQTAPLPPEAEAQIGRASCRERVYDDV